MNKSFLVLVLSVCFAGMGLIMYQEKQENPRSIKMSTPDSVVDKSSAVLAPQTFPAPPPQANALPTPRSRADEAANSRLSEARASDIKLGGVRLSETGSEERNAADKKISDQKSQENTTATESGKISDKSPPPEKNTRSIPSQPQTENFPSTVLPVAPAVSVPPASTATKSGAGSSDPQRATVQKNAKLAVISREKGTTVRLTNSGPVRYQTMNLTNPERLVVDVVGAAELKAPSVPKNLYVTNVRLGKNKDTTRIVIDLSAKPIHTRFVLSREKDVLEILLD